MIQKIEADGECGDKCYKKKERRDAWHARLLPEAAIPQAERRDYGDREDERHEPEGDVGVEPESRCKSAENGHRDAAGAERAQKEREPK